MRLIFLIFCVFLLLRVLLSSSDTHHLSPPLISVISYYRGRGAFESLGAGLSMEPGDIAFKCNFATLEEEDEGGRGRRRPGRKRNPAPTPLVVSRAPGPTGPSRRPAPSSARRSTGWSCRASRAWRCGSGTRRSTGPAWSCSTWGAVYSSRSSGGNPATLGPGPPAGGENGDDGAGRRRKLKPFFELSDAVSGTDPLKDNLAPETLRSPLPPPKDAEEEEGEQEGVPRGAAQRGAGERGGEEEKLTNARKTAEIVNELSDEIRRRS